jgi:hypothetical protein
MLTWEAINLDQAGDLMTNIQRFLLFILLPLIAPLLIPPAVFTTNTGLALLPIAIAISSVPVGWMIYRGSSTALTLAIFLQGLNVIIRLMMFFPHVLTQTGRIDIPWVVASLLSMGLSTYLALRLDRTDVRVLMVT